MMGVAIGPCPSQVVGAQGYFNPYGAFVLCLPFLLWRRWVCRSGQRTMQALPCRAALGIWSITFARSFLGASLHVLPLLFKITRPQSLAHPIS